MKKKKIILFAFLVFLSMMFFISIKIKIKNQHLGIIQIQIDSISTCNHKYLIILNKSLQKEFLNQPILIFLKEDKKILYLKSPTWINDNKILIEHLEGPIYLQNIIVIGKSINIWKYMCNNILR